MYMFHSLMLVVGKISAINFINPSPILLTIRLENSIMYVLFKDDIILYMFTLT